MKKDGFRVRLQTDKVVEMEFYGVIGSASYFFQDDDFVHTTAVLAALNEVNTHTLKMYYNSPGGDAYDGFQIKNRLELIREKGQVKKIEAHGEGLIASAATLPYLVADVRVMRNGARFMIHKPWAYGGGNAVDMRKLADQLDKTESEAIDLYESKSALTREEIAAAMEAETYYSPKEAETAGFATKIIEPFAIAACVSPLLKSFLHLPDDFPIIDPTSREAEEKQDSEARMKYAESILTNWDLTAAGL